MYEIVTKSKKAENQYYEILNSRAGIPEKLEKLREDPRNKLDAHKLKGKLDGLWSCSLGSNIRMIYRIDDNTKEIVVYAVGSHKIYG